MRAIISDITDAATGIRSFELVHESGGALPAFTSGAHIDVHLPSGLVRQYSLVNQSNGKYYTICVNLDPASRGGSAYMHQELARGDVLDISAPRNNFPLNEAADHSILIAGGIGITPIYAMVNRLSELGRAWRLYHCTRSIERTPFADELRELTAGSPGEVVHIHDGIPGVRPLDIKEVIANAHETANFYCCGPAPLMDAFDIAVAQIPHTRIHTERFATEPVHRNDDQPIELICARSNLTMTVPANTTILEALEANGMTPLCSCREGLCGTCEVTVLSGEPDHRDVVLSPEERDSNKTMMICVSRALGGQLELDI